MAQPSPMRDFAPLLTTARPTLYQTNGFRLIGVAVDADTSEINRQLQKVELIQKFGATGQQPVSSILPLMAPPSLATLQDAKQRLMDPRSRLVEELFWFWPETPHGSKSDLAIHALQRGDSQSATEIWVARGKKPTDSSAIHNLAILSHVQALDSINAANDGNVPEAVWIRAWKYWRAVVEHDPFWQRLGARIEELDDPRLSVTAASQIRSSLCSAILQIDLSLAISAAEAGQFAKAGSHLKIARESGFAPDVIRRRTEHAAMHVRNRIENLCVEADQKCTVQVEQIPSILRTLAGDCRPHLEILNYLAGSGSGIRDTAHDQVAKVIRENLVLYGNKTDDWKGCEQLLSLAAPLAVSESQKGRIADDLVTLKRLRAAVTCWFCKENVGDEKRAAIVEMYGNVTRSPTWNGTQFQWRNLPIKIPRCRQCRNLHLARKIVTSTVVGLVAAVIAWDSAEPYVPAFFATCAAWLGTVVAGHVGWFGWARAQDGKRFSVLRERGKREHPLVEEMKAQQWAFGKRPSDAPSQLSGSVVGKFFAWFGVFLLLTWLFSVFGDSNSSVSQRGESRPVSRAAESAQQKRDIFDTVAGTQRDTLGQEIESNKARLQALSAEFQSCQSGLEQYRSSIDSDRQQLDQMQSNSRIGLDVDQSEYESVRQRHNSSVQLFNNQLRKCRSLAGEHDTLVETTNAKVREYNRLVGAR